MSAMQWRDVSLESQVPGGLRGHVGGGPQSLCDEGSPGTDRWEMGPGEAVA